MNKIITNPNIIEVDGIIIGGTWMNLVLEYQWTTFVVAEILSLLSLLLFGLFRYFFVKTRYSLLFILILSLLFLASRPSKVIVLP